MFEVDTYLRRIGFTGERKPTVETLRALHKGHLMSVAYDSSHFINSFTGFRNVVDIDIDQAFTDIVVNGNGGVCHDLNGLFRRLLADMGYEVELLAASQRWPNGRFGPDLEHTFGCVRLDGDIWLVDVGFAGPSYLEPLRVSGEDSHQYGCDYRLSEQGAHHVLERKGRTGEWRPVYRFELRPREVAEWDSPEATGVGAVVSDSLFAGTALRGRALPNGQMVLTGKRLLRVEDGHEKIRTLIDPAEYDSVVKDILAGNG